MKLNRRQLRQFIIKEMKMLSEDMQSDMEELVAEKPNDRALGTAKFRGNMNMARQSAISDAVNKLSKKKNKSTLSHKVIKFNIDMAKKKAYVVIELA